MDSRRFAELAAQNFNRIPVYRDVFADLDTPLSAYLKLARGPYSYLFESVQGGEKWGRYSIIGLPAQTLLKVFGHSVQIARNGELIEQHEVADPLAFIETFQQRFRVAPIDGLPAFSGGLVGYFGYDTVRYVEQRLAKSCPPDALGTPDILLMVSEDVLVFDNLGGTLKLITHADPAQINALAQA
ncbi:MAG TPA: anthranilate synthase component I, partial [Spongiibacteraceae bacterium]